MLAGKAMPQEALARLLGLDNQILTTTLTTLLTFGVASLDAESGAIMSRRMVRDEEIRQVRKLCGKMGGNPNLVNQNQTTQVKVNPTPSSSSSSSISSSTSVNKKEEEPPLPPKGGRAPRFTPPTLEEVTAYCLERGRGLNPEKWIDHYQANGWKVGRNSMKDWKASVRYWENGNQNGEAKYESKSRVGPHTGKLEKNSREFPEHLTL